MTRARTQLVAVMRAAVVRHVRIAVHDMADAVSAELQVDRIAVFACHVADWRRRRHPNGCPAEQRRCRPPKRSSVHLIRRRSSGCCLPTHEADGGIRDPAVDVDRQIEADQIAVLQVVIVRNAVQHGVVHGNADVVRERTGAEIRSIVDVAGFGALCDRRCACGRIRRFPADWCQPW